MNALLAVGRMLQAAWGWLRAVSGDDAYERYVSHHARVHPHLPLPSRREFYASEEQRKWNGINRCC
jgi:uncharacterized short protein YbdD (DUF466 family)